MNFTKMIIIAVGAIILSVMSCQNVFAQGRDVDGYTDEDGYTVIYHEDENGAPWASLYNPEGDLVLMIEVTDEGNPNPDDGSGGGAPSADSIKDAIERHYKGRLTKGVQHNNPFTTGQNHRGKGLAPRWNPSDTIREAEAGGGSGGSGPASNSGSTSEWIKSLAKAGQNGDNDDENEGGDNSEKPGLGTTGSIKPEHINPVPTLLGATTAKPMKISDSDFATQLPVKGFNMNRIGLAKDQIEAGQTSAQIPRNNNLNPGNNISALTATQPRFTEKEKMRVNGAAQAKTITSSVNTLKISTQPQLKSLAAETKGSANTMKAQIAPVLHTGGQKITVK